MMQTLLIALSFIRVVLLAVAIYYLWLERPLGSPTFVNRALLVANLSVYSLFVLIARTFFEYVGPSAFVTSWSSAIYIHVALSLCITGWSIVSKAKRYGTLD